MLGRYSSVSCKKMQRAGDEKPNKLVGLLRRMTVKKEVQMFMRETEEFRSSLKLRTKKVCDKMKWHQGKGFKQGSPYSTAFSM